MVIKAEDSSSNSLEGFSVKRLYKSAGVFPLIVLVFHLTSLQLEAKRNTFKNYSCFFKLKIQTLEILQKW